MEFFETEIKGKHYKVLKEKVGSTVWLSFGGWSFKQDLPIGKRLKSKTSSTGGNSKEIRSPMPGQLIKLNVKAGDKIKAGQTLAVLEAMKMEHSLKANIDAVVDSVMFREKDSLQMDDLIIKLKDT